jgi:hypothetical protein
VQGRRRRAPPAFAPVLRLLEGGAGLESADQRRGGADLFLRHSKLRRPTDKAGLPGRGEGGSWRQGDNLRLLQPLRVFYLSRIAPLDRIRELLQLQEQHHPDAGRRGLLFVRIMRADFLLFGLWEFANLLFVLRRLQRRQLRDDVVQRVITVQ